MGRSSSISSSIPPAIETDEFPSYRTCVWWDLPAMEMISGGYCKWMMSPQGESTPEHYEKSSSRERAAKEQAMIKQKS